MGTTSKYGLRYPDAGAANNVPGDMQNLASDVDALLSAATHDVAANRPTAGKYGRWFFATDTNVLSFDTGTSWLTVPIVVGLSSDLAASNPGDSAAAGSTGKWADAGHRHARETYARDLQGTAELTTYTEKLVNLGNMGAATAVDLSQARQFFGMLNANCTVSFTNTPGAANIVVSFTLYLQQDATGGRTVTWPASVSWGAAGAPLLSTTGGKTDIVSFISYNNGTTWLGVPGLPGF